MRFRRTRKAKVVGNTGPLTTGPGQTTLKMSGTILIFPA